MTFEPYIFCLTAFLTSWFYCHLEMLHKYTCPQRVETELFECKDGGTMGISWYLDPKTGKGKPERNNVKKPILLLLPGLGGGIDNSYTHILALEAQKHGYQVAIVNFRGNGGIPITSYKVLCSCCWWDVKEAVDFVHTHYLINADTKEKQTQMYAYGASMGALLLGLYLANESENAKVDGAGLYGCAYDVPNGAEYFYNNAYGMYSWACGICLVNGIIAQLPQLRRYCSKEEGERITHAL